LIIGQIEIADNVICRSITGDHRRSAKDKLTAGFVYTAAISCGIAADLAAGHSKHAA
jgi:uncharacterized protein YcfJ